MKAKSRRRAEEADGRAALYELFSALFLEEPDEEFLLSLREAGDELEEAGVDTSKVVYDDVTDEAVRDLAVEYCAIFVGPGKHFSPYGSIFLEEGFLHGETTNAVKDFYGEEGVEMVGERGELPDHLGMELGFMAEMARREAEVERGDDGGAHRLRQRQWEFLDRFLIDWGPDFCETVAAFTNEGFYEELFELAARFLKKDYEYLSSD